MTHTMKLHAAPYNAIKNGTKTIELRLYDDKRKMISVGDEIEFVNATNTALSLRCTVIALHVFSSFDELYRHLPLLQCGYSDLDISTASARDMDLYYSKQEQDTYGVVGIEITYAT